MPDTFTCAVCRQTFEVAHSDEEALAEATALFGETLGDDPVAVCDACYREMDAALPIAQWIEDERKGRG